MEEGSYKIYKRWIKEINFEALILQVPDSDIEDKLTYLAQEQGNISKDAYHQFLLFQCVANVQQMAHVVQASVQASEYEKVKNDVVCLILEVNPKLDPETLIINKNGVLKIRVADELAEGERLLMENKFWNTPAENKDYNAYKVGPDGYQDDNQAEADSTPEPEFVTVERWWNRLRRYVEVRQFKEEDLLKKLVKEKQFYDASSFRTYVVTICVVDYKDLFTSLDEEGIPKRVHPQTLLKEIYGLCKDVNPYLVFERVQELIEDAGGACGTCGMERGDLEGKMGSLTKCGNLTKPVAKLRFKDIDKTVLLGLGESMKSKLVGQDEAIDVLEKAIQRARVGLKDPAKPIGSFLFVGPTGVGKTLTSKVLAEKLTKSKKNMVVIDCSEYSSDHEYSKLIGAPAGYVGHDEGGMLTRAVMKNPFSVVVFDELEKASDKIRELLLQILEEGRLTDGKGQAVSFKDTVIVMTSNVGVTDVDEVSKTIGFGDVAEVTNERKNKAIKKAIKQKFKPEFINRIDAIVYFNNLIKPDFMKIIELELDKLNENLKVNNSEFKGISVQFDDKVRKFIYEKGIDAMYGARPLKRCIEREVADPLALILLTNDNVKNGVAKISVNRGKLTFEVEQSEDVGEVMGTVANY